MGLQNSPVNQETSQSAGEQSVKHSKLLSRSWVATYGFVVALVLFMYGTFFPSPLQDVESWLFGGTLTNANQILIHYATGGALTVALPIVLLLFAYYTYRKFKKSQSRSPTVLLHEKLVFTPLGLWAIAYISLFLWVVLPALQEHSGEDLGGFAILSFLQTLLVFPIEVMLFGTLASLFIRSRRRYTWVTIVLVVFIATMPLIGRALSPLQDAVNRQSEERDQTSLTKVTSIADCNKISDSVWSQCIEQTLKTKSDYEQCLHQVADGDAGKINFCDRLYSPIEIAQSKDLASCAGTIAPDSFFGCVKKNFLAHNQLTQCIQIAKTKDITQQCGRYAGEYKNTCLSAYSTTASLADCYMQDVRITNSVASCAEMSTVADPARCWQVIVAGITSLTDPNICLQFVRPNQTGYDSNAASYRQDCFGRILGLQKKENNQTGVITTCGLIATKTSERMLYPSYCSTTTYDTYYQQQIDGISSVSGCEQVISDFNMGYWLTCLKKTLKTGPDYQTCLQIAARQQNNQGSYKIYCDEAHQAVGTP